MARLKRFTSQKLRSTPSRCKSSPPPHRTYSSLMYYTELDPLTREPIYVEKEFRGKVRQKEIVTRKKAKEILIMNTYFAVTAPGLEPFTRQEAVELDLIPAPATATETATELEPGGVTFKGELDALYRANLHLRTASRVLARLGNFFYAKTYKDLLEKASRLPWERFLHPGQPVTLRISYHESQLNHARPISDAVHNAIANRLGKPSQGTDR